MAVKSIRISSHARFEMRRRGISEALVRRMIRNPGQVLPTAKGRHIYQGLIGGGRRLWLRVIVKEAPHVYHVVTAYKTNKIAKYGRKP